MSAVPLFAPEPADSCIAALLVAHELHVVQAVQPLRTVWRCRTCDGYEVDATSIRHSIAQADHQAHILADVFDWDDSFLDDWPAVVDTADIATIAAKEATG